MSSDHRVYVGPYLAVPLAVQRVEGPVLVQCSSENPKHNVDKGMKFCPHCGKAVKITKREDLKPTSISVYNIANADDLVWHPEYSVITGSDGVQYDVWISNNTSLVGGRYVEDDTIISTLDNMEQFYKEGMKFREMLTPIIDEIEEQYGVVALVGHGIVPYWS